MSRKAYMYSAYEQAGRMLARINEYLDRVNLPRVRHVERQDCMHMLERIVSNELDRRSLWASPRDSESLFQELLPWTRDLEPGQEYEEFYTDVIIHASREANHWIEVFMPTIHGYNGKTGTRNSWVIWYVKAVGRDIIVEEGPDFRIADWTERMKSGEWAGGNSVFAELEVQSYGEHRDEIETHGDYISPRDCRGGPRRDVMPGTDKPRDRRPAPSSAPTVDNIPSVLERIRGNKDEGGLDTLVGTKKRPTVVGYGTGDI